MLVNRCKKYVFINNKAAILLLMAIYKKNQATLSQNLVQRFQPVVKRRRRHAFMGI